ncbi:spinster family MFS transporter [Phenylobacterium terrae]|uniref:Spinster family MFS transporter n=1 Tax=Phenylobacterium terrae TaxID=2665495 RepID=A0ABW4MVE6_9CAUL
MTATAEAGGRARWTRYQVFVLAALVLVNGFNYLDRAILNILQEPIKADLALTDTQLGMISGPAFAILYTLASVPIARWAQRGDRTTILSLALAIWSGATAACGAAMSYVHLFVSRLFVGLGEGACSPTSYSLVADYFPARQRGMAMAAISASIPIAGFVAPLAGGFIAHEWGWRWAFVIVGLPGVALAVALKATLRDPRKAGRAAAGEAARPSNFLADIRLLAANRAFVFFFFANAFMGMAISGTNVFTASYFIRQYGMSLREAGVIVALGLGLAGLAGTFLGGFLSDRFAGERGRSYLILPSVGAGLAGCLFLVTFTREIWPVALAFLILANVATDLKNATVLAAAQNMSPDHMRPTTAAVTMIAVTLLGTAIGPLIVGTLSDLTAAREFAGGLGDFAAACPGGRGAGAAAAACAEASAAGMRAGLLAISGVYFAAMTMFGLSAWALKERLN